MRRILITVLVAGNPRGCCGRKEPHDNYRMAIIHDDGTVEITKQYDSHLRLIGDHGRWEGAYSTVCQAERNLIDREIIPLTGDKFS